MQARHIHQKTPFSHANLKKKRSLLPKNTLPLPLKPLRLINHPVTLQNSILRPGNITQSHKQPPINLLIIYNSTHYISQPASSISPIHLHPHQPHQQERPREFNSRSINNKISQSLSFLKTPHSHDVPIPNYTCNSPTVASKK